MRELTLSHRPTSDLVPYAQNARTHDDAQVGQIADSITEFGFTNPVLIDEHNGIIAGHGRVMAAKLLGVDSVPVIVLDGLTEAQKRAYILADNKLALNAGWNDVMLKLELVELKALGYQLNLTGFSELVLKGYFGKEDPVRDGATDPDATPAINPVPVSKLGDIWHLGRHKLLVGDATAASDVQRLLGDFRADLIWTDPPYNVAYVSKDGKSIENDDMVQAEFDKFLARAMHCCFWALRPGGAIYVSHSDTQRRAFTQAFQEAGIKLAQVLIWVKNAAVLGRQDYNWQHEPILYGWREGAAHYYDGDFSRTTAIVQDDLDISKMRVDECRALIRTLIASQRSTVIREPKPQKSELHPSMKPVALVTRMLEASSREDDLVFDPFGGSGTTLISAERINRRAFLMELDLRYADVIIRRWQEFTARDAKLQNGTTFDQAARLGPNKAA